jgi:hypothetical protein
MVRGANTADAWDLKLISKPVERDGRKTLYGAASVAAELIVAFNI